MFALSDAREYSFFEAAATVFKYGTKKNEYSRPSNAVYTFQPLTSVWLRKVCASSSPPEVLKDNPVNYKHFLVC